MQRPWGWEQAWGISLGPGELEKSGQGRDGVVHSDTGWWELCEPQSGRWLNSCP